MKSRDEFWLMSVEPNAKYFEGVVIDAHMTMNENYFMTIGSLSKIIYNFDDGKFRTYQSIHPTTNLLVPKRRERVLVECKAMKSNQKYIFKLLKERFSEKYMVSEVFG